MGSGECGPCVWPLGIKVLGGLTIPIFLLFEMLLWASRGLSFKSLLDLL
jgi:hypothetical protein